MDRLRRDAWREVVGDARGFYESHPFVVLFGGAVLGTALTSGPRLAEKKRRILGLIRMASSWIGPAFRAVENARRAEAASN